MPKDLAFCLKLDLVGAYLMFLKEFQIIRKGIGCRPEPMNDNNCLMYQGNDEGYGKPD